MKIEVRARKLAFRWSLLMAVLIAIGWSIPFVVTGNLYMSEQIEIKSLEIAFSVPRSLDVLNVLFLFPVLLATSFMVFIPKSENSGEKTKLDRTWNEVLFFTVKFPIWVGIYITCIGGFIAGVIVGFTEGIKGVPVCFIEVFLFSCAVISLVYYGGWFLKSGALKRFGGVVKRFGGVMKRFSGAMKGAMKRFWCWSIVRVPVVEAPKDAKEEAK